MDDHEKTVFNYESQMSAVKEFVIWIVQCNAPATFEHSMETVLRRLSCETSLVYLDDIIIVGRTFEDNLRNNHIVLEKLKMGNLKLKFTKYNLFRLEVSYSGHVVSS